MDSYEKDIWSDDEWKALMRFYFNFFENEKDGDKQKLNAFHHIKYKLLCHLDEQLKNTNDYALFYNYVYNPLVYTLKKKLL